MLLPAQISDMSAGIPAEREKVMKTRKMLSLILALIMTAGVFGIFAMNETVASAAPRVPRPENFRISASEDGCYQLS